MNGQSLDTVSSVSRRIWSATTSRGDGAPTDAFCSSALSTVRQRGVDDLGVQLHQVGDLLARPHLPVLAGTPRAGRQFDRVRRRTRRRPHRTACRPGCPPRAARAARAPATPGPRTTSGRTVRCRTRRSRARAGRCASVSASSRSAHHLDEVGDVRVDRGVGALGVVRRLGVRRHVAAGDPGRLESGDVVVGVEVAVGGVARDSRTSATTPGS